MKHVVWSRLSSIGIAALVVTCCISRTAGAEQDNGKKVNKKDVPAAVLTAFEAAYPNVTIKEVEKIESNGKISYELETKDGSVGRDVVYLADGTLLEVKEEVSASSLPEAVKSAVAAKYPKGKIHESEKVTRDQGIQYELGVRVGKEKIELVLDQNGTILSTAKDTGDKDEGESEDKDDDNGKEEKE